MRSYGQFDYLPEDISYFADQLKQQSLDIVCLQESHSNSVRSLSQLMAKYMNYEFVFDVPHNKSHIDADYDLTLSIISRMPFSEQMILDLPNPNFVKNFYDGRQYHSFDEKIQCVNVGGIYVANSMFLPVGIFGEEYDSSKNIGYKTKIEAVLLKLPKPLIFCADMNFDNPELIYAEFFRIFQVKNALGQEITRPVTAERGSRPDKILFTPKFDLINQKVIKANTDHWLCVAQLEVKG